MHPVESMEKFPHVRFQAGLSESGRLLHVLDFFFWKDSIQEHSLDIVLLKMPVKGSSHMEHYMKRFESGSGRCHLTEVSPPDLLESFCHPMDLETYWVSNFIALQPTYKPSP